MAFLESSRYARVETVQARSASGATVTAVKLRRLSAPDAGPYTVQSRDRLDGLAQGLYGDGTWFWHIADANTELEAHRLTAAPGAVIQVPAK